jgi:hypothetical protein
MAEGTILRFSTCNGDRRVAPRLQTRLRVDFCPIVTKNEGLTIGGPQRGVTQDLSVSGLFLGEVGYLQIGATLHLMLRLPDVPANPIVCFAKVVRREKDGRAGYALRFLQLSDADAVRLSHFVRGLKARKARLALAS